MDNLLKEILKVHTPPACLGHADTYASSGDTAILRGRGELGPHNKFGARSGQVHQ